MGDLVDVATTAQNDADAAHKAQKATYEQQKDEYEDAQKRHAKDVEEAKETYKTATGNAVKALSDATDHAAEDQIEANKFADKNKSDADKTTEKMNDARQDIISSDTEILKQLKEFQGELSNIRATDATIQTKFLQVSANYNQMVTEKADETTKWKKSHRDTLEGFDDTLARLETDAEAIRTTTGPKHKKIYEDEKSLIDKVVEDLKQSHSNIVDPLEKTETTLKDTNAKAQKKETSTTNTYNSMKAVVSTERVAATKAAQTERDGVEKVRGEEVAEATNFNARTVKQSTEDRDTATGECDSSYQDRTKLIAGDQQAIAEIAPLLRRLKACAGSNEGKKGAFLEKSETNKRQMQQANAQQEAAAMCALAEQKMQSLIETKAPTTGSLDDWSERVAGETKHNQDVFTSCAKAANDEYNNEKSAADTMKKTAISNAENAAKEALVGADGASGINGNESKKMASLAAKLKKTKDPMDTAVQEFQKASTELSQHELILTAAQGKRDSEVNAAVLTQTEDSKTAALKRKTNVQADKDQANTIQAAAKLEHKTKTATENTEFSAELKHLVAEKAKLEQIVKKLDSMHGDGVKDMGEVDMEADMFKMSNDLAQEVNAAAEEYNKGRSDAAAAQTKHKNEAQVNYDAAINVATNKKEDTIVKANTAKLNAEGDNAKYEEQFNKAHSDGEEKLRQIDAVAKAAQADVVVNEKAQTDSVDSSVEVVESEKKNARRTYRSDIKTQNAEAKQTESIAAAKFKSLTDTMKSSCKSEGGLLADEKLTLELVMDKIHSLVTVKSNVVGAQGDATAAAPTTAAPSLLIPDESPSKPYLPRTDGLCTVDGRSYIGTKEDCTKGAYHMGGAEGLNYPPGCQ